MKSFVEQIVDWPSSSGDARSLYQGVSLESWMSNVPSRHRERVLNLIEDFNKANGKSI